MKVTVASLHGAEMHDRRIEALKITHRIGTLAVDACCSMAGMKTSDQSDWKGLKDPIVHLILGIPSITSHPQQYIGISVDRAIDQLLHLYSLRSKCWLTN